MTTEEVITDETIVAETDDATALQFESAQLTNDRYCWIKRIKVTIFNGYLI